MSKSKILYIIFGAIAGILAIAGVAVAFVLNYDDIAPAKVEVIDNGETIFFKSDVNENYQGYRFVFKSQNSDLVFNSDSNVLPFETIQDKIEIGISYQISSCFIGDNEGGNSKFSEEVTWRSYDYLDKIELSFDSSKNILSWNEVKNADYYKVYYKDIIYTIDNPLCTTFDISALAGGEYTFKVVAYSNSVTHKPAESNLVEVTYTKYFKAFEKVEFEKSKFELTITASEKLEVIRVKLDNESYNIENLNPVKQDGKYIYIVDIKAIYNNQQTVGASPVNIDQYNRYVGSITNA